MLDATQKLTLMEQLSGRRLQEVKWVGDQVQFQFDPPLTIYALAPVSVRPNGERIRQTTDGDFREAILAQISKTVGLVIILEFKSFNLGFDDGSGISLSLRPEDSGGQEVVRVETSTYLLEI
jgi:hypothetical protein